MISEGMIRVELEGSVAMPYVFGDYTLDRRRYELRRGEQRLALEPKAFDLLLYLIEHRDRVVGRDELLEHVWPEQFLSDHSLTARLRSVRQVLGDEARKPRFIETVHGRGYRFIAAVRSVPAPDVAPGAFSQPVVWQRFERVEVASALDSVVPMVGREAEVAFLHQRLERSRHGRRQVVFVTGEAGLGKTTLVDAFVRDVEQAGAVRVGRGQCIEHYGAGEAYLPVLEALEQVCRSPGGRAFMDTLSRQAPTWLVQMPWLLSPTDLERLQQTTLGATRERMLREMARALEVLTTETPLLLVLEDLHWSDASTLDLLAMLARRQEPATLLVLGTYRPEEVMGQGHPLYTMTHELHIHGHCETLALTFLSQAAVAAYLRARCPEAPNLEALTQFIHRRTEGNPLFMVNVVEEVMAQGGMEAGGVPENLQQLLTQRLERLSPDEQRLLEVGSIVGTEFTAAEVASTFAIEIDQVEAHCEELTRRGQWLQAREIETWPDGTVSGRYGFIHALYQEVAYQRVVPARRLHLHRQIGERLESGYGAQAQELAAELAVHFEHGQVYQKAVQYREQAAENAIRRSAYQEAIAHLSHGLRLAGMLPGTAARTRSELRLLTLLASALRNTKGQAAPEVEHTYTRAYALCQQIGDAPQLFPVLRGLWNVYLVRGELQTASAWGEKLFRLAACQQDASLLPWGHCVLGMNAYYRGGLVAARAHFEQGLTLYDRQQHGSLAFLYGLDAGCVASTFLAWILWLLGYPDRALQKSREACALAQELSHSFSLAAAMHWAGRLHQFRQEAQAAREWVEASMTVSTAQGFSSWLATGTILRGWALFKQGQEEEGRSQMRQILSASQTQTSGLWRPYWLALQAEAHGKGRHVAEGLRELDEALGLVAATGECFWEAELYRLKGELLQQADATPQKVAWSSEGCFQTAIEVACRQQARSLELRAATNLARLWQHQGKCHEAQELLIPIYEWFTEGFETADLQEARALLEALSQ
jgi:predicted ATPase/DNA-binding winged helix-turn-helix (wHTH) protein